MLKLLGWVRGGVYLSSASCRTAHPSCLGGQGRSWGAIVLERWEGSLPRGRGGCNACIAFASGKVKNWMCSWIVFAASLVWVEWKIALSHISAFPQFKPRKYKTRPQCDLTQTQSCQQRRPKLPAAALCHPSNLGAEWGERGSQTGQQIMPGGTPRYIYKAARSGAKEWDAYVVMAKFYKCSLE